MFSLWVFLKLSIMKRFVNYTNREGKTYEICASVLPMNGSLTLPLRFENLAKNDVLDFVSNCAEVECLWEWENVQLPFEGVSYISGAYNTDKEFIMEVGEEERERQD